MSAQYFYSSVTSGFYVAGVSELIPEDAIEVTPDKYNELMRGQAEGKQITSDKDGNPVLTDPPALSKAQQVALAENQKSSLMTEAALAVSPLQDAVDLGDSNPAEEALLKSWKQYRVILNRLDLSKAPDISWPVKPS